MDATQCRMARCGLALEAKELAARAGVTYMTLRRLERGEKVSAATAASVKSALEEAGAAFSSRAGRVSVSVPEG